VWELAGDAEKGSSKALGEAKDNLFKKEESMPGSVKKWAKIKKRWPEEGEGPKEIASTKNCTLNDSGAVTLLLWGDWKQ